MWVCATGHKVTATSSSRCALIGVDLEVTALHIFLEWRTQMRWSMGYRSMYTSSCGMLYRTELVKPNTKYLHRHDRQFFQWNFRESIFIFVALIALGNGNSFFNTLGNFREIEVDTKAVQWSMASCLRFLLECSEQVADAPSFQAMSDALRSMQMSRTASTKLCFVENNAVSVIADRTYMIKLA